MQFGLAVRRSLPLSRVHTPDIVFELVSQQMFVLMSKEARANHVSEHYGRAVLPIWQETLVSRAP